MSQPNNGSVNGSAHGDSFLDLAGQDPTPPQFVPPINQAIVPGQAPIYFPNLSDPAFLRQSIRTNFPGHRSSYNASGYVETFQPPSNTPPPQIQQSDFDLFDQLFSQYATNPFQNPTMDQDSQNQSDRSQADQTSQYQSEAGRSIQHPAQHQNQQPIQPPTPHPVQHLVQNHGYQPISPSLQHLLQHSVQPPVQRANQYQSQSPNQHFPPMYPGVLNMQPGQQIDPRLHNVSSLQTQQNQQRQLQERQFQDRQLQLFMAGRASPMMPPMSQTGNNAGMSQIGQVYAPTTSNNMQPRPMSSQFSPHTPMQAVPRQPQSSRPANIEQAISLPTPPSQPSRSLQPQQSPSVRDERVNQQRIQHGNRPALSQRPIRVPRPSPMAWLTYRVDREGKRVNKTIPPPQGTYKTSEGINQTDYSDPRDFFAPTEEEQTQVWAALKPTREDYREMTQIELVRNEMRCLDMGYNASYDEIKRKLVSWIFETFNPDRNGPITTTETVYNPFSELPGYSSQGQVITITPQPNPNNIEFFKKGELAIKPEDHLFKLERWYGLVEDCRFSPNWPYERERNARGFLVQNRECVPCYRCVVEQVFCFGFREHENRKCGPCERRDVVCSSEG